MHGLVSATQALMELLTEVYIYIETDGNTNLYLHVLSRMITPKIRQYSRYEEIREASGEPLKLSRRRGRYSIRPEKREELKHRRQLIHNIRVHAADLRPISPSALPIFLHAQGLDRVLMMPLSIPCS